VSHWVARMMGVNLLTGHVRAGRLDLGAALTVPVTGLSDGERWAVLAPRDVVVTPYGSTTPAPVVGDAEEGTEWSTRVVSVQPTGDRVVLGLEYPAGLTADVAPRPPDGGRWSEGMAVQVRIDPSRVEPFAPPASGARVD